MLQEIARGCRTLQEAAGSCSELQEAAGGCGKLREAAGRYRRLQAVRGCKTLQWAAGGCSRLQEAAGGFSYRRLQEVAAVKQATPAWLPGQRGQECKNARMQAGLACLTA